MQTTYAETAASLDLWREYIDPEMAFSDEEFEAMTIDERIAHIVETFGPEEIIPTVEDVLSKTAIGCGWHEWSTEGGAIRVSTEQLRPALESSYDSMMPAWPSMVDITMI